jgi:hypothetical protein
MSARMFLEDTFCLPSSLSAEQAAAPTTRKDVTSLNRKSGGLIEQSDPTMPRYLPATVLERGWAPSLSLHFCY